MNDLWYNGESESCLDCKRFFATGNDKAHCNTCSYRLTERLLRQKEERASLLEYCDNNVCMDKGGIGCKPENCNYIKSKKVQKRIKHDAEIREQERERVLNELVSQLKKRPDYWISEYEVIKVVESIRKQEWKP